MQLVPLEPTWEDFVPEFTRETLSKRLSTMPYHLATLLYPPNMVCSLSLKSGSVGFLSFYLQPLRKQRKCLEEVMSGIPGLSEDSVRAVGKVKVESLLPRKRQELVYWNGVTWFSGSLGTTPPFVCAYAATELNLRPEKKVLVIGFGYGYLAAVLYESMLSRGEVFGIDMDPSLLDFVRETWVKLGYKVNLRLGDGMLGWGEKAEFDAIWSSLTPRFLPRVWLDELREGGRLGVFRAYTENEYRYALNNIENWSQDFPTFDSYKKEWWREVCLSVYKKENGRLAEVSRLYRLGNVPYVSPVHGISSDREWEPLLGYNESKLVEYFKHHASPKE